MATIDPPLLRLHVPGPADRCRAYQDGYSAALHDLPYDPRLSAQWRLGWVNGYADRAAFRLGLDAMRAAADEADDAALSTE